MPPGLSARRAAFSQARVNVSYSAKPVACASAGSENLSLQEIAGYLASGDWQGKAGGYAVQGQAGAFVTELNGSYSAVVGLPLYETANLLEGLGYPIARRWETSA